MSSESDRNLLLGVLALQLDFINRDQLIAATSAWVADKSRPLDEILLDQSALATDTHPLLLAVVEKHLELHDGSPEKSLMAVHSIGPLKKQLNELDDSDIYASIANLPGSENSAPENSAPEFSAPEFSAPEFSGDPFATNLESVDTARSDGRRFRLLRPHAKGGLGEVFVARDDELNREVALKEIQSRHADDENSRARFMLEAEVTGGLEHPGIVPVYGLGQYDDGRPYYAMRFIRGNSLREAIDRIHGRHTEGDQGRPDPNFDSVDFRKLLGSFVDVCYAVHYAHSRGVLHRDLKPDNIMLGKYGETLIVDWGLAKLKEREEAANDTDEQTLQPSTGSGSVPTQLGKALGTPAYMSPEQAAGRLDELGPTSDVYSLGATLYHLLTGQPPFRNRNLGELLKDVQDGNFVPPREINSNVPRPLDAICRRAMSTNPNGRYSSPIEFADDMEKFLADEPIEAYVEPMFDRARRWVRKHQTLTVTTASLLLLSAISLGVFLTVVSGHNKKLKRLNESLVNANDQIEAEHRMATINADLASLQRDLTLETLASVVSSIQRGLKNLPGSGEVRRNLLLTVLDKIDKTGVGSVVGTVDANHSRITTLFEMSDVVLEFGTADSSIKDNQNSELQRSSVKVARRWLDKAHEMAAALVDADPDSTEARQDLSKSYIKLGYLAERSGAPDEALRNMKEGVGIIQNLAAREPKNDSFRIDSFEGLRKLSQLQTSLQQYNDALESAKQCENAAQAGLTNGDKGFWTVNLRIAYALVGDVQMRRKKIAEACNYYQKALTLTKSMPASNPADASLRLSHMGIWQSRIANAYLELGQTDKALTAAQSSLEIAREIYDKDPTNYQRERDLTGALETIGKIYFKEKRFADALESYQTVLAMDQEVAKADPNNAAVQTWQAYSHRNVGESFEALNRFPEAVKEYESAAEIMRRLIERDMNVERSRRSLRFYEKAAASAKQAIIAIGDIEKLLEQPKSDLPQLLARRSLAMAIRGRFEDAADAARKLRALPNVEAEQLATAVKVFGLCAESIKSPDGEELSPEQRKKREAYLAEAAAASQQAATTGLKQLGFGL